MREVIIDLPPHSLHLLFDDRRALAAVADGGEAISHFIERREALSDQPQTGRNEQERPRRHCQEVLDVADLIAARDAIHDDVTSGVVVEYRADEQKRDHVRDGGHRQHPDERAEEETCAEGGHYEAIRYPRPRTVSMMPAPTLRRRRAMKTSTVLESRLKSCA